MKNHKTYYGIDVSKLTFDVVDDFGNHLVFENNKKGFLAFLKLLKKDCLCVMEVTGIYHLLLATFLFKKKIDLSVVNPLRIKRFSQMHLRRNKTDKADAGMICLYGKTQETTLWKPLSKTMMESKDTYQVMEQLIDIRASLKNKVSGLKSKKGSKYLIEMVINQIDDLTKNIDKLEKKLKDLIQLGHADLFKNIKSIVGIGDRTAILLIISTNAFKDFDTAKQLASYFGLAPTESSSGTSINGSRKISKMGKPLVRKKLYMCSLQASRFNKACVDLYDRLLAKGKPKKLALIAVSNKLLTIVFAISKSKTPFDRNYVSYRKSA